jgi:hypothetical protein
LSCTSVSIPPKWWRGGFPIASDEPQSDRENAMLNLHIPPGYCSASVSILILMLVFGLYVELCEEGFASRQALYRHPPHGKESTFNQYDKPF